MKPGLIIIGFFILTDMIAAFIIALKFSRLTNGEQTRTVGALGVFFILVFAGRLIEMFSYVLHAEWLMWVSHALITIGMWRVYYVMIPRRTDH